MMINSIIVSTFFLSIALTEGWTTPRVSAPPQAKRSVALSMNLLSDIGDMVSGGKLVPQSSLPYGSPLSAEKFNGDDEEKSVYAVQEKLVSWTGEDFDIYDASNQPFVSVRGALLHLPGKDKMRIINPEDGSILATLDRKLIAMTPTYDIYRGDCEEKIRWLNKELVSLSETFDFFAECEKGGIGPFAAPPAYRLEGDFLERNFVMKNKDGQVVAKVIEDRIIEFDSFNHYQLQVAAGMDPVLVVACACAIDEELEEEHQKRRQEE